MKGILLARLSILAAAVLTLAPFSSAQAKLAGDWQGTFEQNGVPFQLVWHVTAASDGTLTSTLDNVTQNIFGIRTKKTTVKGSEVKIEVGVKTEIVDAVIEAITTAAKTGQIGDGKIFVTQIDKVVRIRTGETDGDAL